jgi:ferredoxin like protein
MLELGSVADRLARNRYDPDPASHIEVDQAAARSTGTAALLVRACPAGVYTQGPDGELVVQHVACLECGTCLALAAPGSLRWTYPVGGRGVAFREG